MKTQFCVVSLVVLGACVAGSSKADSTYSWDFNSSNIMLSASNGNSQNTTGLLNLTDTIGAASASSGSVDVTGLTTGSSIENNAGILQLNTLSGGSQTGGHVVVTNLLQNSGISSGISNVRAGVSLSRGASASGFLNSQGSVGAGSSVLPNFSQPSSGGTNGSGINPKLEGGNITPEASTLLSFGGMLALGGLAIRRRVHK